MSVNDNYAVESRYTDLCQGRLAEHLDLQRALQLRVGPQSRPANFKHASDDRIRVLPESLEYGSERIPMLLQKRDLHGVWASGVQEGEDEQEVKSPDV